MPVRAAKGALQEHTDEQNANGFNHYFNSRVSLYRLHMKSTAPRRNCVHATTRAAWIVILPIDYFACLATKTLHSRRERIDLWGVVYPTSRPGYTSRKSPRRKKTLFVLLSCEIDAPGEHKEAPRCCVSFLNFYFDHPRYGVSIPRCMSEYEFLIYTAGKKKAGTRFRAG